MGKQWTNIQGSIFVMSEEHQVYCIQLTGRMYQNSAVTGGVKQSEMNPRP